MLTQIKHQTQREVTLSENLQEWQFNRIIVYKNAIKFTVMLCLKETQQTDLRQQY